MAEGGQGGKGRGKGKGRVALARNPRNDSQLPSPVQTDTRIPFGKLALDFHEGGK